MTEYNCAVCYGYYYTTSNDPDFIKCPYCGAGKVEKAAEPLLKATMKAMDMIFGEGK